MIRTCAGVAVVFCDYMGGSSCGCTAPGGKDVTMECMACFEGELASYYRQTCKRKEHYYFGELSYSVMYRYHFHDTTRAL